MSPMDLVQSILVASHINSKVREMPQSTRTAKEAAAAIGCSVGQIVKSLLFRTKKQSTPILVLTSGSNRVDEKKLAVAIGEAVEMASPDFVLKQTGFAIGGVSPIGHPAPLMTLIDVALFQYDEIWAAAGGPFHVFPIKPTELEAITHGQRSVVS